MHAVIMLILCSVWIAWTVLADFFIVPAVFQLVPDFFLAGRVAIELFTRLNRLEFPVATALLAFNVLLSRHQVGWRKLVPLNVALMGLSAVYLFSLTPKITELTHAWEYAEKMGTLGAAGHADVQQLHQDYHRTYVALDTVKLLLLLGQASVLGVSLSRRKG